MKFNLPLILVMTVFLNSCNSSLEDPDSVEADEILKLTVEKEILTSGGSDYTRIIARTPKEAGTIDVTFTTTAGLFQQSNAKTIKELTDSVSGNYRYASTKLLSDTTVGQVYITAEAKTARQRIEVVFN